EHTAFAARADPIATGYALVRRASLDRIPDILNPVELDVDERPADLLHPTHIHGLHRLAGRRIDRHRTARAFPRHALGGRDQGVAVAVAVALFQRLVDEMHAVVAAHRKEIGIALEGGVERGHELLVQPGTVIVVVVRRGDDAERGVTYAFQ